MVKLNHGRGEYIYIYGDKEVVQIARNQLVEKRAKEMEIFKEYAIQPSDQLKRCTNDMNQSLLAYYKELGIDNIQIPKHIFFIPKSKAAEIRDKISYVPRQSKAFSATGLIVVFVPDPESDTPSNDFFNQTKEAYTASAYAHELYHSVSGGAYEARTKKSTGFLAKIRARIIGQKEVDKRSTRSGLNYLLAKEVRHGDALEEGLADIWTTREQKIVKDFFPLGSHYSENHTTLNDYPYSNALVRFLMVKDPDFLGLAERARIRGETLSLARLLDKRHGKGTYRKVASATETTASEVLQELKQTSLETA